MTSNIQQSDLEAYIDEALPAEEVAAVERALREDRKLLEQLSSINARRNAGVHSISEIWRQHRLSCISREQLGGYLLETLSNDVADYVKFHLEVVGCRYCQANLADLQSQQKEDSQQSHSRRRKYFQSSAGYLHR